MYIDFMLRSLLVKTFEKTGYMYHNYFLRFRQSYPRLTKQILRYGSSHLFIYLFIFGFHRVTRKYIILLAILKCLILFKKILNI